MSRCYRPSNGSEGEGFTAKFCETCERDRAYREDEAQEGCDILARALIFDIDKPGFPREWTYDEDNNPTCTAYLSPGSQYPTNAMLEEAGQIRLI